MITDRSVEGIVENARTVSNVVWNSKNQNSIRDPKFQVALKNMCQVQREQVHYNVACGQDEAGRPAIRCNLKHCAYVPRH